MVDRRPCALWSAAVLIGICAIGFQAYAADATASDASLPQDITNRSDPRLPAAGPSRVIIRYSKDDPIARQHAIRLARALNEQGLEVAEPVASPGRIASNTVSYFYNEDRPGAEIAARVLGSWWKAVQQRLPAREPFPRPGALELALAGP